MKTMTLMAATLLWVISFFGLVDSSLAGTVEEVKKGSKTIAKEIKEDAIETGKTFVEAGKKVKEGSKETWKEIKKGVRETGEEFKKAFQNKKEKEPSKNSGEQTK